MADRQVAAGSEVHRREDLNGDSLVDLILTSAVQSEVLLGQNDGGLQSAFDALVGPTAYSSISEDVNGDGVQDLVILSNSGLQMWTRETDGTLREHFTVPIAEFQQRFPRLAMRWTGDINQDGQTDYVIHELAELHVILSGDVTPLTDTFVIRDLPSVNTRIDFADVTGDDLPDAIIWEDDVNQWEPATEAITVWQQHPDGSFSQLASPDAVGTFISAVDINRDGWRELIALHQGQEVFVWQNLAGTGFEASILVGSNGSTSYTATAYGDLNHDGYNDVVIGWNRQSSFSNGWQVGPGQRLTILFSQPNGTFDRPLTYAFPGSFNLGNVILSDVDQDGDLDVQLEGHAGDEYDPYPYANNDDAPITRRGVILNQVDQLWPVGDVNRDGRFDSSDLVAVFEAGEYEDDLAENSTWIDGDWNGDGDFTSDDVILAFQQGKYVAE